MGFLPELGRKAAAPPDGAGAVAWRLPVGMAGRPYSAAWDLKRAIEEGMRRVTWAFRAVDAIASNQVRLPAIARKGNRTRGQEIADHPVAGLLNSYANSAEVGPIFRYRLSCQALLSRKGAFVEVQRNRLGRIIGLYLLPPEYTNPIPDEKTFVSGFEVRWPGGEPIIMTPERVCWVRLKPHPTDPYAQMTFLEAAGLAIDTDWLLHNYQRNFIRDGGGVQGVLNVKGDFEPEEAEDIRQRFNGPPGAAGRIGVINSEEMSFQQTQLTHEQAQYIEALKAGKEEILSAAGVPESVIGNASGRTFDNANAERTVFWLETELPHCGMLGACLDQIDRDPTTFIGFDAEDVDVIRAMRVASEQHMLEEVHAGTRSRESYRDDTGKEPSGVPALADYYIPFTLQPIGSAPAPAPAALVAAGKAACTCARDGVPGRLGHKAWCPVTIAEGQAVMAQRKAAKMAERPLDASDPSVRSELKASRRRELADDERLMTRELTRHFRREARVVRKKLSARATVPSADDLFDRKKWALQLGEDIQPVLEEVYQRWGDRVIEQFSKRALAVETKAETPAFDVHDPGVTARIEAQINRLTGVEDTTYEDIKQALADGEEAGEGIPEIGKRIQSVFDEAEASRADTIARTEVLSAANGASMEAAGQDGTAETKEWLATEDDRTREAHAEADGQSVGMNELFDVGGEALEYPGDPAGDPGNTINCRCTLVFS